MPNFDVGGGASWSGGNTSAQHPGGSGLNPVDSSIFQPTRKKLITSTGEKYVRKAKHRGSVIIEK